MEQHTNTFEKGMNTDLSKTVYSKNQYLRADNLRLITEFGKSEVSLESIKGTAVNKSIPRTSSVMKLRIDPNGMAWLGSATIELSRPSINPTVFTDTWTVGNLPNFSVAQIHELLRDFINSSPTFSLAGFQAATQGEYVVIWNTDTNGGDIVIGGSLIFNFPSNVFVTVIVGALSGLRIIGRGYIRDTIVLFTSTSSNTAPEPELLNSDGQIWTLDYQPANPVQSTLILRYNNILNFTAAHPIPSGVDGAIGRFENDFIQRIYWTDNFNRPRQLNVIDPDTMALTPGSLELKSPAHFTEAVLQNIIQNGSVGTGLHNFAYRLLKTNGEASVYSPVSKTVHVVGFNEETAPYSSYRESTVPSTAAKSLQYRIRNLDTSFDSIEIVNIHRENTTSVPEITRFLSEPIPSDGIFNFTFTGDEDNLVDITIPEFEFSSIRFKTVKSMADKNNRLFLSNVKIDTFSIDFDARAYRWPSDQSALYQADRTKVLDVAGNEAEVGPFNSFILDETHDAINPNQSPTSANNYLWQQNGQTLGGTGVNVSYTFTGPNETDGGGTRNTDMHLDSANSQGGPGNGYVRNGTTPYTYDIGQEEVYRNGIAFRNHHSPYISGSFRGYQRDEVYRFGLVLYSLDGVPSDVKWIADIRMPHVYMFDMNPSAPFYTQRTRQFPIYTGSAGVCFGYNLGVKFNVDVSSVATQISGWSIVRVKREQEDRTVLGQGMHFAAWAHWDDFVGGSFLDTRLLPHYEFDDWNPSIYYSPANDFSTMNSPDFLFGGYPGFRTGDTVEFVDVLNFRVGTMPRRWFILRDSAPTNLPSGVIPSMFITYWDTSDDVRNGITASPSALFGTPLTLEDFTQVVDQWYSNPNPLVHVPAGNVVNVGPNTGPGNPGQLSQGGRTLLLRIPGGSPNDLVNQTFWADDGITAAQGNKYLVNYKRSAPLQYGGQSFSQRSQNEYLYCGQFQPTDDNSATFTDVIVFGGDTYVCMFDNIKRFKNWNGHPVYGISNVDAEDDGVHQCQAFPCETIHNIDLRGPVSDPLVNNKQFVDNTGNGINQIEDFSLNPLWSMQDNLKTFFPKPVGALDVEVFDHRTYASQPKIDGELQDSWTVFPVNDYIDVEGKYGPINSTCVLNDRFYYLQDRALGLHSVNERVLTQDLTGITLQLGTGQVLERFDYISTEVGTKHQWSVLPDTSGLYFYCSTLNRIYVLTAEGLEPISSTKGIQAHLNQSYGILIDQDNPILGGGILVGKNPRYNEILFSFISNGEAFFPIQDTLCYNNKIEQFTGFYGFTPKIYLNFNNNLFSCKFPPSAGAEFIWWHDVSNYNSFYGIIKPSTLKLLINPNPLETKTFDNMSWHTEATSFFGADVPFETFNTLQSSTNYQDSGIITLVDGINLKRKERTWQLGAGRNNTADQERLRDKYLIANLTHTNLSGRKLIVHYINTHYRKSYR